MGCGGDSMVIEAVRRSSFIVRKVLKARGTKNEKR